MSRGGEADRVRQDVEQDLPNAFSVRLERADIRRNIDLHRERGLGEAILDPAHDGIDGGADIDRLRAQLERTGVDRGEIENVVEDRQQGFGRSQDVIRIVALTGIERADRLVPEQLRKADDVGERRAQLVRHVVDEFVAQSRGPLQRFVALGQGARHVDARGDVDECQQGCAVRKRLGGAFEHRAVAPVDTAIHAHAKVGEPGHRAAQIHPGLVLRCEEAAGADHRIDMRMLAGEVVRQFPQF